MRPAIDTVRMHKRPQNGGRGQRGLEARGGRVWAGDTQRDRVRARRFFTAALAVALAVPLTLAVDGAAAHATVTCTYTVNCAPTNVFYYQQESAQYGTNPTGLDALSQSGIKICGIQDRFTPLDALDADGVYDDPLGMGRTTEGNYTDSETISFRPSTSIAFGDSIKISLPHPSEPYSGAGSVLPPAQVNINPAPNSIEVNPVAFNSTVGLTELQVGASQVATVSVTLVGDVKAERVQLKTWDPYNPPAVDFNSLSYNIGHTYTPPASYGLTIQPSHADPADSNKTVAVTSGGASNTASWTVATTKGESLVFSVDVLLAYSTAVGHEGVDYRLQRTTLGDFGSGTSSASEQAMLRRLAVVAGTFDIDAVEALSGRDLGEDQIGIGETLERDGNDAAALVAEHARRLECEPGLPGAAASRERHEPGAVVLDQGEQLRELVRAPEHPRRVTPARHRHSALATADRFRPPAGNPSPGRRPVTVLRTFLPAHTSERADLPSRSSP